ncbi:amino acid synthesis family protein [Aquabacterium humicola]|uniref:amino acid synthesis family protein n=1 Tax=Aquabacterium humicola TaxID=3237377 RepID=UPI0025431DBF|nr:amino acid synthesis family protein [Rubrivivax pictus]
MLAIRKLLTFVEDVQGEAGQALQRPVRRTVAAAVVCNPMAGRFVADLSAMHEEGALLADRLLDLALAAWPRDAATCIESYGKAGIVGTGGELEHLAALLHPCFGRQVRTRLRHATSIMPSTAKRAAPGTGIDVPLHNVGDMWSFDHFDTVTLQTGDAPAPDELLIALALADGGRPLARTARP